MGYRIDYPHPSKSRPGAGMAGWLLACMLLASVLWPRGREVLASFLFPGDRAVTVAAFETLARDVGQGEELGPALEAFCRHLLEGTGDPD